MSPQNTMVYFFFFFIWTSSNTYNKIKNAYYVSAGSEEAMTWLEEKLGEAYELQTQKLSGDASHQSEGKVLNIIISRTPEGWEIEADPRHAELIIEQLGLEEDKGIGTPGLSGADEEDEQASLEVPPRFILSNSRR